jgi:hypothetical protein
MRRWQQEHERMRRGSVTFTAHTCVCGSEGLSEAHFLNARIDQTPGVDSVLVKVGPDGVADGLAALEHAGNQSGALLLVMGPGFASRTGEDGSRRLDNPGDGVRRAIALAVAKDMPVVQVSVNDAAPPAAGELPAGLTWLPDRPVMPLRAADLPENAAAIAGLIGGYGEKYSELSRLRAEAARRMEIDAASAHPAGAPGKISARNRWLRFGAMTALLLLTAVVTGGLGLPGSKVDLRDAGPVAADASTNDVAAVRKERDELAAARKWLEEERARDQIQLAADARELGKLREVLDSWSHRVVNLEEQMQAHDETHRALQTDVTKVRTETLAAVQELNIRFGQRRGEADAAGNDVRQPVKNEESTASESGAGQGAPPPGTGIVIEIMVENVPNEYDSKFMESLVLAAIRGNYAQIRGIHADPPPAKSAGAASRLVKLTVDRDALADLRVAGLRAACQSSAPACRISRTMRPWYVDGAAGGHAGADVIVGITKERLMAENLDSVHGKLGLTGRAAPKITRSGTPRGLGAVYLLDDSHLQFSWGGGDSDRSKGGAETVGDGSDLLRLTPQGFISVLRSEDAPAPIRAAR